MKRRSRAFWVGAFVIGGTAIAILAVVWFGASDWFRERQVYVTYFDDSIQGLLVDAEVKFRGVGVGKVRSFRVAPDGNLIEVTLELARDFNVADEMRVKLRFAGITGLKYLEIDYPDPTRPDRAPALSFKPPHPVIPSQPGGLEELEESFKALYDKLVAIDTGKISDSTIRFLQRGTDVMDAADSLFRGPEMKDWMTNLNRAAGRLDSLLILANQKAYGTRVDSLLVDLHAGARNFSELMATVNTEMTALRLGSRADSLLSRLDTVIRSSQHLIAQSQYATLQTMNNLAVTMNEMNAALSQLHSLMLTLENYPSNLLYTAPPPKEK